MQLINSVLLCNFFTFVLIWVIFPLAFMNSVTLERFLIFLNVQNPKKPEFNNPQKYDLDGVVNFYINTKDNNNSSALSIGAWLVVPERQIKLTKIQTHDKQTVSAILQATNYPIVLYLHGVGCNRIKPKETYEIIRKKFMIVSLDHRGYGDSSPGIDPSEQGIANDTVQIFKWIRKKTNNDIYIWGHSLGASLGTYSVRKLKEEDIVPSGLVLESTFTTLSEEILNKFAYLCAWVPWFRATVLNPLNKNSFKFNTTSNILSVDCPIMILHAEDDKIINYRLGKKLADVASTQRTIPPQGNVSFHLFGDLGYGHTGITADPNIPGFIDYLGCYLFSIALFTPDLLVYAKSTKSKKTLAY